MASTAKLDYNGPRGPAVAYCANQSSKTQGEGLVAERVIRGECDENGLTMFHQAINSDEHEIASMMASRRGYYRLLGKKWLDSASCDIEARISRVRQNCC